MYVQFRSWVAYRGSGVQQQPHVICLILFHLTPRIQNPKKPQNIHTNENNHRKICEKNSKKKGRRKLEGRMMQTKISAADNHRSEFPELECTPLYPPTR